MSDDIPLETEIHVTSGLHAANLISIWMSTSQPVYKPFSLRNKTGSSNIPLIKTVIQKQYGDPIHASVFGSFDLN
jgi:hypothetical protein